MSDGDIVRGKLGRAYQKPYEALSQGKATNDECIHSLLKALQRDLKNQDNLPVVLAQKMDATISKAINESGGVIFINWAYLRQELNKLAQEMDGPPYLKELVLRASRRVLHGIQYGANNIDINCLSQNILYRYSIEIYESNFKECIPPNTDQSLIDKLEQLEPNIFSVLENWSKQADQDRRFKKIKLPSLKNKKQINCEEDLMADCNHKNSNKINTILESFSDKHPITNWDLKKAFS